MKAWWQSIAGIVACVSYALTLHGIMAAAGVSHRVIVVGCCCCDLSSFILFLLIYIIEKELQLNHLFDRKGFEDHSFVVALLLIK